MSLLLEALKRAEQEKQKNILSEPPHEEEAGSFKPPAAPRPPSERPEETAFPTLKLSEPVAEDAPPVSGLAAREAVSELALEALSLEHPALHPPGQTAQIPARASENPLKPPATPPEDKPPATPPEETGHASTSPDGESSHKLPAPPPKPLQRLRPKRHVPSKVPLTPDNSGKRQTS